MGFTHVFDACKNVTYFHEGGFSYRNLFCDRDKSDYNIADKSGTSNKKYPLTLKVNIYIEIMPLKQSIFIRKASVKTYRRSSFLVKANELTDRLWMLFEPSNLQKKGL